VRSPTHDDWDARLVKNLRAAGGNPFTPYEVDFFFNRAGRGRLCVGAQHPGAGGLCHRHPHHERRGGQRLFAARAQAPANIGDRDAGFSQRFRALAQKFGGYYDGWMTDPSRK
jgi:hypothetical protein